MKQLQEYDFFTVAIDFCLNVAAVE